MSVRHMEGEALALKPKLADNVVLKQKRSMAARPARREPNVLKQCVGYERLKI